MSSMVAIRTCSTVEVKSTHWPSWGRRSSETRVSSRLVALATIPLSSAL
jgi:hypothetical protein